MKFEYNLKLFEMIDIKWKREGFFGCQTPTSTVRLKAKGCRGKKGGFTIEGVGLILKNEGIWERGEGYHKFV